MVKRWIPKTIRGKITAATAGITFIITVLTTTVCFSVFQSFLNKNQIQSAEFSLQVLGGNISADMKDIIYFSKWCCSNSEIIHYLEAFQDQPKLSTAGKDYPALRSLALESYERLKEEFYSNRSQGYISRAIISTTNRNNFLQMTAQSNRSYSNAPDYPAKSEFFDKLYEDPDYLWIGLVDDPFTKVCPFSIIPIVRPVYDEYNSEIVGWTYVEIHSSIFTHYLSSYPLASDSTLFLTIGDKTYGASQGGWFEVSAPCEDGKVIAKKTTLDDKTRVLSVTTKDGASRTLVERPVEDMDGWYISQILSQQQLHGQRQVYLLLLAAICAAIISLGLLLTFLLNQIINRPILKLTRKISAISEGDFTADPDIEWKHELGDIGRGINAMAKNIVTLMDKRVSDEKQKKDLEYQILQSQINPHFLYNTLNSIKWMATIQNASGIADMTTALARLLKNVSKSTSPMVTLREELDLIQDYFLIQQYRYGGSITIEYIIRSKELYDCEIHRFTLQPIIENALFHGIEPKGTAGKITVTAQSVESPRGRDLTINITDNGVGMTQETIEQVLHEDVSNQNKTEFFRHVGISNVNQRIRYDFGPEYGITIQSEAGVYTTMTILLPCKIKGEDNV